VVSPEHHDAELLIRTLREQGQRVTTGRRAIAEVVAANPDLSAEEIVGFVQLDHPEVHPSTVYRTLETLEEAGLVRHVHLGHGPARWQLADDPSHRLVCEGCGAVQLVPRVRFDEVRREVEAEFGFAIAFGHFAMTGRCSACH
jgi:Fur family transcriptional regulator, ferric uptake regulator